MTKLQKLFGNVSHEFRTPISLIRGPLESLSSAPGLVKYKNDFEIISRNTERLGCLVDQALEISKIDLTGKDAIQNYHISSDLNLLVGAFEPLAIQKGQSIRFSESGCDVAVVLLRDTLERVVNNLLSNAIKYAPCGSPISVKAIVSDKKFKFSVHNWGEALTGYELDAVFDRFIRLDNSENESGCGIGLAVVKELVMANGGEIMVSSTEEAGTTFEAVFDLDYFADSPQSIPNACEAPIHKPGETISERVSDPMYGGRPTVLIVEDNNDMRQFLYECLAEKYCCVEALDGQAGFLKAAEYIPDLIISDVKMPIKDGLTMLKEIREHESTCHIPMILLTARDDKSSRNKGWALNADDYVPKPFSQDELLLRVARLLALRQIVISKHVELLELKKQREAKSEFSIFFSNPKDQRFYDKFVKVIKRNYEDESFNRGKAASEMALSERQLNRKLSSLIDYNFSEFLRKYRLIQARIALLEGEQITEISFSVGFSSPSYFTNCFKQEFGETPSQFVKRRDAA